MSFQLEEIEDPVIFDIGANIGKTLDRFGVEFRHPEIHAFEPGKVAFDILSRKSFKHSSVTINNLGIGSELSSLTLNQNEFIDMSSFLPSGKHSWGNIENTIEVPVTTVDNYASENGIDYIHILKSDTQGFDLEVMKGSQRMMSENRIKLVYFEFIFSDMYQNLPNFDEIFNYLRENNFEVVAFYDQHFQDGKLGWADFLFINTAGVDK
ncbi:MAG: FkbM family methyltransferase [Verrucomicrobiales bacterium]|nr:FkbM family methyltransferase [Verrucomicrobiales bacterium]